MRLYPIHTVCSTTKEVQFPPRSKERGLHCEDLMTGFYMPIFNAEPVMHHLDYRDNGVSRTTRSGEDLFLLCDGIVVHTVNDIRDVSLPRCR